MRASRVVMVVHQQIVVVEAAERHEEHLALGAERIPRADQPRDDARIGRLAGWTWVRVEIARQIDVVQRGVDDAFQLNRTAA